MTQQRNGSSGFSVRRRDLIKTAGALTAGLAMPGVLRAAPKVTQLTVADSGGPIGEAWREAFYDPFEKETGIKVANVARQAEPTAQFKAMVDMKTYLWDACSLTLSARDILVADDLLEPIGVSGEQAAGLMPEALTDTWMGVYVYATVMAYRTDIFKNSQPASWADFWDTERFPGRRSLRRNPIDTLEEALLADGVELDKLYPLDVERAFKKLDQIKPHVAAWWTGGAQSTQLIQSGEVALLAGWNARIQSLIDGGTPVKIVWNQGLYSLEGWGIPKGSPKADVARQFVQFCADAQRQAKMTERLAYGPTNLKAYSSIPQERAQMLPTYEANLKLMTVAQEGWWSTNRSAMTERFTSWLLD